MCQVVQANNTRIKQKQKQKQTIQEKTIDSSMEKEQSTNKQDAVKQEDTAVKQDRKRILGWQEQQQQQEQQQARKRAKIQNDGDSSSDDKSSEPGETSNKDEGDSSSDEPETMDIEANYVDKVILPNIQVPEALDSMDIIQVYIICFVSRDSSVLIDFHPWSLCNRRMFLLEPNVQLHYEQVWRSLMTQLSPANPPSHGDSSGEFQVAHHPFCLAESWFLAIAPWEDSVVQELSE